jgi:NitT/TauT family transport system substrate-binding protein
MRLLFLVSAVAIACGPLLAPAVEADPLRVGVIPVMGAAPLFVAQGEGWFKNAGLDLQQSPGASANLDLPRDQ